MATAVFERHRLAVLGAVKHDRLIEQRARARRRGELAVPTGDIPGVLDEGGWVAVRCRWTWRFLLSTGGMIVTPQRVLN